MARFIHKNTTVRPDETVFDVTYQRVAAFKKNAGSIGYKKIVAPSKSSALLHFTEWASNRKSNIRLIDIC